MMENQTPILNSQNLIDSQITVDNDQIKNEFTCVICLGLIIKPILLKCCDHLICTLCLKYHIRSSFAVPKCPLCKHNLIYTVPNKIIMRVYSSIRIQCPTCQLIITLDKFMLHFYNECNQVKGFKFCEKCNDVFKIEQANNSTSANLTYSDFTEKNGKYSSHICLSNTKELSEPKLHHHNLIFTDMRKHVNYEREGWLCDFCEGKYLPEDKSFHCKKCGIDVCNTCFYYIQNKSEQTSVHQHELKLFPAVDWKCNLCKSDKMSSIAWSCIACNFDVCLKCYWK